MSLSVRLNLFGGSTFATPHCQHQLSENQEALLQKRVNRFFGVVLKEYRRRNIFYIQLTLDMDEDLNLVNIDLHYALLSPEHVNFFYTVWNNDNYDLESGTEYFRTLCNKTHPKEIFFYPTPQSPLFSFLHLYLQSFGQKKSEYIEFLKNAKSHVVEISNIASFAELIDDKAEVKELYLEELALRGVSKENDILFSLGFNRFLKDNKITFETFEVLSIDKENLSEIEQEDAIANASLFYAYIIISRLSEEEAKSFSKAVMSFVSFIEAQINTPSTMLNFILLAAKDNTLLLSEIKNVMNNDAFNEFTNEVISNPTFPKKTLDCGIEIFDFQKIFPTGEESICFGLR